MKKLTRAISFAAFLCTVGAVAGTSACTPAQSANAVTTIENVLSAADQACVDAAMLGAFLAGASNPTVQDIQKACPAIHAVETAIQDGINDWTANSQPVLAKAMSTGAVAPKPRAK
jgi:hypothetical protein